MSYAYRVIFNVEKKPSDYERDGTHSLGAEMRYINYSDTFKRVSFCVFKTMSSEVGKVDDVTSR